MDKQQIKQLLQIKTIEDIKSLNIIDQYEDDHQQCAEVEINGINVEFLWFDELGFLQYYNESAKAAMKLLHAIRFFVFATLDQMDEADFDEEMQQLYSELSKEF
jgi:hypothetical protein